MTDESDVILGLLNGKSSVQVFVGTFVTATAAAMTVDVATGRIPAVPLTSYLPEINEPIWVMFVDGTPYVTGPTKVKPGKGTVLSVAANQVTLSTIVGPLTMPYSSTLTPSAGQKMKVVWQGGPFAVAVMSIDPIDPVAPPGGGGAATTHVDTFTAQDAGSYQGGRWWQAEVWASDGNLGAWFFGSKIADTIPAGAVVSRVQLFASMRQVYGNAPNFALHSDLGKGGSPSLGATTAIGVGGSGWIDLPAGYGNSLKHGGGALGVGVAHGGYNKFASLAEDGQTGALRITSLY